MRHRALLDLPIAGWMVAQIDTLISARRDVGPCSVSSLCCDVSAEVSNRSGLLHCQGAADHRENVSEGPGGDNCGKSGQVGISPSTRCRTVCFFSPVRCPLGRKHWLFRSAAPFEARPPKHRVRRWYGDILADAVSILYSSATLWALKCIYLTHSRLRILSCVCVKGDGWSQPRVPPACDSLFQPVPLDFAGFATSN